jgi:hypothetical protein
VARARSAKARAEHGDAKLQATGREPDMIKRVMWGVLIAAMMAAAGLLARRLSATIWQTATGEEPPTRNV